MNATNKIIKNDNKFVLLELMRFIAAFAVLIWHYQHFSYLADKPIEFVRSAQPFYTYLHLFYNYGYYGVQVFWCISGFIFFWKYKKIIIEKTSSAKIFFQLRFSRLYPLHLVTLFMTAALQFVYFSKNDVYFVYQFNDLTHFIFQLFLASEWGFENGSSFNGPIWSVSAEVLVYFLFFNILRIFGGSVYINIVILIIYVIARFLEISSTVLNCLAFFYLGGISAMAYEYFKDKKINSLIMYFGTVFVIGASFCIYALNAYGLELSPVIFVVAVIPVILFLGANTIALPLIAQKIINTAGNMTYSSYLIHFPIQLLIVLYFSSLKQQVPYNSIYFFLVFICSTLVMSYFIYYFFENPIQIYIRTIFKSKNLRNRVVHK